MNLKTETIVRVYISDLIQYICEKENMTFNEVESQIPNHFLEGCWLSDEDPTVILSSIIYYMRANNISRMYIYQNM